MVEQKELRSLQMGDLFEYPLAGQVVIDENGQVTTGEIFNTYTGENKNEASGDYSHAEGHNTIASGDYSHAEGHNTIAKGSHSHASGLGTKAEADRQFVIGAYNADNSQAYFIIGNGTEDEARSNLLTVSNNEINYTGTNIVTPELEIKSDSIKFGHNENNNSYNTSLSNEGMAIKNVVDINKDGLKLYTTNNEDQPQEMAIINNNGIWYNNSNGTVNLYVTAGQNPNIASGERATAEGYVTVASGKYSHAEGKESKAYGEASHAEGFSSALGNYSHAEGSSATGAYAINSENGDIQTDEDGNEIIDTSKGQYAHSEGYNTVASGNYSHAEGHDTIAAGESSHTSGTGTIASASNQFVIGEYNEQKDGPYFIIGNGSQGNRSNLFEINNNEIKFKNKKLALNENFDTKYLAQKPASDKPTTWVYGEIFTGIFYHGYPIYRREILCSIKGTYTNQTIERSFLTSDGKHAFNYNHNSKTYENNKICLLGYSGGAIYKRAENTDSLMENIFYPLPYYDTNKNELSFKGSYNSLYYLQVNGDWNSSDYYIILFFDYIKVPNN